MLLYYTILHCTILYYLYYTKLYYSTLLAQQGMARLFIPVFPLDHHLHGKAWPEPKCWRWPLVITSKVRQAILYYTILYYSTLLAQRGMARLCVPVCSSVITCTARHGQNEYYTTIAQCLHSEAWLDCTFVAPQLDWPKTLYSRIPWVENTSILNTYSGMEEYGGNTCLAPSRPQIPQQCRQLNP